MKRGDGGHQPGRGPGLGEAPEQPAGPGAGLGWGAWGRRDRRSAEPAGVRRAKRRVGFTGRRETGQREVWKRVAGSSEKLVTGVLQGSEKKKGNLCK